MPDATSLFFLQELLQGHLVPVVGVGQGAVGVENQGVSLSGSG